MITEFKAGHWYVWTGPKERQACWNESGMMDFILDGKPHQCKHGNDVFASFYDSPDPDYEWFWSPADLRYFKEVPAPHTEEH